MRICSALLLMTLSMLGSGSVHAQHASAGYRKIEALQKKLSTMDITPQSAIPMWSAIAKDPDVKADKDANGIAYGSEGLLWLGIGDSLKADSVLTRAMPLFRVKTSKALFIVALSDLDRHLQRYAMAMRSYEEILRTLDSLPQLDEIDFYHQSGYAPFAYGIDAALGMAKTAIADSSYRERSIILLRRVVEKHPSDALGVMAIVALKQLDPAYIKDYDFQLNLACSRKRELRHISDKFATQFSRK